MRRLIPCLGLLLAACSPPEDPTAGPALSFGSGGGAYAWRMANGATKGGLLLVETGGVRGRPALVLTCDNLKTGGLQARVFSADPGPATLELTAGRAVMTVPARPGRVGDQRVLEGEGDLPPDWASALGSAPVLRLRYGDQGLEVQAPEPELAEAFGRHCRSLDGGAR